MTHARPHAAAKSLGSSHGRQPRSARRARRVSRRRSPLIGWRWRHGPASASRSDGQRRRTISAMRSRRSASARTARRVSRRRSPLIGWRWRNGPASTSRSDGQRRRSISAVRSRRHVASRGGDRRLSVGAGGMDRRSVLILAWSRSTKHGTLSCFTRTTSQAIGLMHNSRPTLQIQAQQF